MLSVDCFRAMMERQCYQPEDDKINDITIVRIKILDKYLPFLD